MNPFRETIPASKSVKQVAIELARWNRKCKNRKRKPTIKKP